MKLGITSPVHREEAVRTIVLACLPVVWNDNNTTVETREHHSLYGGFDIFITRKIFVPYDRMRTDSAIDIIAHATREIREPLPPKSKFRKFTSPIRP